MKLEWRYILKSDGSPSSDPIITNSIARIDDPDFDLHANFGGQKSGETSWLLRMLAACARLLLSCAPFVIMRAFCYLWRRYRIRWFSGSRWDTLLVWYLNYLLNFKTDQDLNTSNLLPFWVCIHLSWKVVYWNIILMPRALLRSKWCNVRPASVAWSSPKSKKIFQLPPSRFRAKSACVVVSDAM